MAQFEAKEIGARIAQARRESGLTQEQLAEMAPFSTRSLQDYERGLTVPYKQMREIARLLDRPIEWFLHGEPEPGIDLLELRDHLDRRFDELDRKLDLLDVSERMAAIEEQLRSVERALEQV